MYTDTTGTSLGGYTCGSCGQFVTHGTTHICPGNYPVYPYNPQPAPTNYGWICPKCGRVNAPTKQTCDCSIGTYPYYPWVTWTSGTISIKDDGTYTLYNDATPILYNPEAPEGTVYVDLSDGTKLCIETGNDINKYNY